MLEKHTNKVLETILTAKKYKNREDVIATAEAIKYFVYASDNGIRQADKMLYFIAYGNNDNSCF